MSDDYENMERLSKWLMAGPPNYDELEAIIADATPRHDQPPQLTAEQIIQKYYMRRGRNKKLTLRQHIKDSGTSLSEGYIRKLKVAYDKRHKRRKGR